MESKTVVIQILILKQLCRTGLDLFPLLWFCGDKGVFVYEVP